MNSRELRNIVLGECIRLINDIKELPSHTIDNMINNRKPFMESKEVNLLCFLKKDMTNEELELVNETITIASGIDSAIREYREHNDVDNFKGLINQIDKFYSLLN